MSINPLTACMFSTLTLWTHVHAICAALSCKVIITWNNEKSLWEMIILQHRKNLPPSFLWVLSLPNYPHTHLLIRTFLPHQVRDHAQEEERRRGTWRYWPPVSILPGLFGTTLLGQHHSNVYILEWGRGGWLGWFWLGQVTAAFHSKWSWILVFSLPISYSLPQCLVAHMHVQTYTLSDRFLRFQGLWQPGWRLSRAGPAIVVINTVGGCR